MNCSRLFAFFLLLVSLAALAAVPVAHASGDRDTTVTIYVHGFDLAGVTYTGVVGEDITDILIENIAAMSGLPTINSPGGYYAPNLITTCTYYGDTWPSYYTPEDIAEMNTSIQQWGGGVPLYGAICGKFARHVLERTGAEQVNLLASSFGAEVSRWIVTHDVEQLTSEHRIARWLTLEGALNGAWPASANFVQWLWDIIGTPTIDLAHLNHDWVETNFPHSRRTFDYPAASYIMQGHTLSTNDDLYAKGLTTFMLLVGDFISNDGICCAEDGVFSEVTANTRYHDMMPTLSWHPVTHLDLKSYEGCYLTCLNFVESNVRASVTVTSLSIDNLHERNSFFFNDGDSEILLSSTVFSPEGYSRYGILDSSSQRTYAGAASPIHMFKQTGNYKTINQVVYDDMLTPGETLLSVNLEVIELDFDARYDQWEITGHDLTDMGNAATHIDVTKDGYYHVDGPEWNCFVEVKLTKYPITHSLYMPESRDPGYQELSVYGGTTRLSIDMGPNQAGYHFIVHGGFSGTDPGQNLGNGVHLPINPDKYSRYLANNPNTDLHQNFDGYLDGNGFSTAIFNSKGITLPPQALGQTLYWAVSVYDNQGTPVKASNAVAVKVVPY